VSGMPFYGNLNSVDWLAVPLCILVVPEEMKQEKAGSEHV
jgi:hypothetical protein